MLEKLRGEQTVIIWTIVRIYLGWEWLVAGWGKIGNFNASGYLKSAIAKATEEYPEVDKWYAAFLEGFALSNVGFINFMITWGEVLVGLGLILGIFTTIALYAGAFMNLNFMLAGTTSTNPILYTLTIILLVIGPVVYRYSIDYYLLPKLREMYKNKT